MNGEPAARPSSDVARWLRSLALPGWIRIVAAALMAAVVGGGVAVLGHGLATADTDEIGSAIALLTVGVPIVLAVLAVTFGQNSDRRLKSLTTRVLKTEIPAAIADNLETSGSRPVRTEATDRGCCADYVLRVGDADETRMDFRVELNVWKANVCFWVDGATLPPELDPDSPEVAPFRHVIRGALREGYELNPVPATRTDGAVVRHGLLFVKSLSDEFLLEPARRLYFTQDFAFFVRGMFEALRADRAARGGS